MATGKKCGLTGKGAFARECLAPASKACKGRPDFQACRREHISRCRERVCRPIYIR